MNALDTNVWIYSHDTRDPRKQYVAQQLIATTSSLALLWQVGCEFLAVSRKLQPLGFTQAQAWQALAAMQRAASTILYPDASVWAETEVLEARHSLSFWDALLIAACIRGGVHTLYTEDCGAPCVIDGLTLVNPFSIP